MIKHVSYDNYAFIMDAASNLGRSASVHDVFNYAVLRFRNASYNAKSLPKTKQIHVIFMDCFFKANQNGLIDAVPFVNAELTDIKSIELTDTSVTLHRRYSMTDLVIDRKKVLAFVW